MTFLLSQFLFLFFGLIGLLIWAGSEIPLAMREIALNTRRDSADGSSYSMIKVFSVCMKVLAIVLWLMAAAGIVYMVAVFEPGSGFGSMFGIFR
jgi:hypothetical protein